MKLVRRDAGAGSPGGSPGARPPRVSAGQRATEAAIERELSRYVSLACGHLTTREDMLRYALWVTDKRRPAFCDHCGKYVGLQPKKIRPPMPDEPLF